jgi:type I restriction enzyme S subunit
MSQKQALKDLGKGTTISYISRKKFEDYLFPLPPLAEQKRIVTKIEQLLHEIDKLKV